MPVRYLESDKNVKDIPYRNEFERLKDRLSESEFSYAVNALNEMIDGDEIHTSSWMPGRDWSGTAFDPIYQKAAQKNFDVAAKFFGLLVFYVFMQRDELWITGKFEKDGEPIKGRTYFQPR